MGKGPSGDLGAFYHEVRLGYIRTWASECMGTRVHEHHDIWVRLGVSALAWRFSAGDGMHGLWVAFINGSLTYLGVITTKQW